MTQTPSQVAAAALLAAADYISGDGDVYLDDTTADNLISVLREVAAGLASQKEAAAPVGDDAAKLAELIWQVQDIFNDGPDDSDKAMATGLFLEAVTLAKKIRAASRAPVASPAEPMPHWQLIETAPKGSKAILVHCADRKNTYTATWARDEEFPWSGKWKHFPGGFIDEVPTHWMPCPATPPVGAGGAGRPDSFHSDSGECDRVQRVELSGDELALFQQTLEDFADCGETETDYEVLVNWAQRGLLECINFQPTAAAHRMLSSITSTDQKGNAA